MNIKMVDLFGENIEDDINVYVLEKKYRYSSISNITIDFSGVNFISKINIQKIISFISFERFYKISIINANDNIQEVINTITNDINNYLPETKKTLINEIIIDQYMINILGLNTNYIQLSVSEKLKDKDIIDDNVDNNFYLALYVKENTRIVKQLLNKILSNIKQDIMKKLYKGEY